ncbi:hypothetical protein [aff. Roholtiella sp. LEGE 12411]|uniref:hypothetical protein n=1 Tax=aff. Roholtiella sp. LEGE 12411 TaxID=1828822 RepID=UPI0018817A15|nr:hypothetical protein [aff. Roholtiella sp. LEGE 12411]MBE9039174.1 hypothetical protein [aff. Roholtiella sp. LEGE 12411]
MLKFTQNQLEFLILVQNQDDWHYEALVKVVDEYHRDENFMLGKKLSKAEFEEMMEKLEAFSPSKICDLQMALNYLLKRKITWLQNSYHSKQNKAEGTHAEDR